MHLCLTVAAKRLVATSFHLCELLCTSKLCCCSKLPPMFKQKLLSRSTRFKIVKFTKYCMYERQTNKQTYIYSFFTNNLILCPFLNILCPVNDLCHSSSCNKCMEKERESVPQISSQESCLKTGNFKANIFSVIQTFFCLLLFGLLIRWFH